MWILLQVLVSGEIGACDASKASYAMNQARVAVRGYVHMTRHGSYLARNKEFSRECGLVLLLSSSDTAAVGKHEEAVGVTFQTSSRATAYYESQQLYRFDLVREAQPVTVHGRLIVKKAHRLEGGDGFGPQGKFRVALLVEDLEISGKTERKR